MKNFTYVRATSVQDVIARTAQDPTATVIAGGTNLVDRLKVFLEEPSQLIDISCLQIQQIERLPDGGLQIGALVTNTALADHADIRRDYPLLSRAILRGASQQIRNVATVGGNIMQRTRCPYYYDTAFACNKRQPRSGCPAIAGVNRLHAILGASDQCVAAHPSDMCVALSVLDAIVEVAGPRGQRQIPFVDFHRLPGDTPQRDTNLEPGELITHIFLRPMAYARSGVYLKLRDRASYAFALVSAAAVLDISGEEIRTARLALGGVAHRPWRATPAEKFLIGQPANPSVFEQAANLALQEAAPLSGNQYKVDLAKRLIRRVLTVSASRGGMV
ncbi:MAG: xanthine dehydrogenase family protein subunit M [Cyanobacteria bacterium P01_H01_bin.21]